MRNGLSGNMVSLVMQDKRKHCGDDMTESEKSIEMAHCGLDVVGFPTTIGVLLKSWNSFILAQLGSY